MTHDERIQKFFDDLLWEEARASVRLDQSVTYNADYLITARLLAQEQRSTEILVTLATTLRLELQKALRSNRRLRNRLRREKQLRLRKPDPYEAAADVLFRLMTETFKGADGERNESNDGKRGDSDGICGDA